MCIIKLLPIIFWKWQKKNNLHILSKEGIDYGHWVLLDIGDLIVHIFLPETRNYYNIDELLVKIVRRPVQENER